VEYDRKTLLYILTFFPGFNKDEEGITVNEFLSKLNDGLAGIYSTEEAEELIGKFFKDMKIEKIQCGNASDRFRQVKNVEYK
jgi:hypothetical protein|tara:strand:+ start:1461 stop:1706 length:246 start_codon:yes stop_codon:yes gene_type:complete